MNIEHISDNIFRIPEDPTCAPDPRGLGVLFMERMQKFKDNVAQIDAETGATLTHGEILTRSIRVAKHMQKRLISSQDIIVLCSYNNMDCTLPFFAGLFLGVPVAAMDPTLSTSDFKYLLNMVKPRFIFSGPESVDTFESLVKECNLKSDIVVYGETKKHIPFREFMQSTENEDQFRAKPVKDLFDTALIHFSSGTTGYPKGICSNHYAIQYNQEGMLKAVDPSVIVYFTTLYWISATMLLTISVLAGTARVIVKTFNENNIIEIFEKYKVSFSFLAPIHTYKLTKKYKSLDLNLPYLHYLMIGGGKVSDDQMLAIKKLFPTSIVCCVYGMTEAAGCISYFCSKRDNHLINEKFKCCGRPVSGLTYKFVDAETGKTVGKNKVGELRIKGQPLMKGYFNSAENAAIFDEEGFLPTGDIGYYDEDYCFYIVDRIKDLIKYQSWHIVPTELEDILLSHPAIKEAAIIGKPHAVDGEHIAACIILYPGVKINTSEILDYYNDKIEGFERRKLRGGIYILENIIRTPSGKVLRRKMRDLLMEELIK